jgi:hypothetical protein
MINAEAKFRYETDEEFYKKDRVFWSDEDREAYRAEGKRRQVAKDQERERLEAQRAAELNAKKAIIPYSEALATEICERISVGELLINICLDEHMPTMRRVTQWLKEHSDFKSLYETLLMTGSISFRRK